MMALARVVCDCGHAVQRELLCHRYRWAEFGHRTHELLEFDEFVSFVLGAPPTSPLGLAVNEGWTLTDHLLASRLEQAEGLIHLVGRHHRPGVEPQEEECDGGPPAEEVVSPGEVAAAVALGGAFDTFDSPEDFEARLARFKSRRLQQVSDG